MHSARLRIRSGMLAGIAPVLLLTASIAAAAAAPQNLATFAPPQPARDFPAGTADAAPSAASMADIASSIREIVTGRQFEHMMSRKSDRDAIVAFYRARDFQPMWIADSAPSARASVALAHLRTIGDDGLDPNDYPMPKLDAGSALAQAEAELKFTATLLTYARHAMTGRVHFSRVSPDIDYKLAFDPDDVLKTIAASDDLAKTLEEFNPPQPEYRALKAKLAELRGQPDKPVANRIAGGVVLRTSRDSRGRETVMMDPRVPLLRERLNLAAEPNSEYNTELAKAVGRFQQAHGILASGQLNAPTVEALNGPSRSKRIEAVLATMERWRWMPRDLGRIHVVLNVPDYQLRVYDNGKPIWQTRTVVGTPGHATPLLTERMKSITVNPTWNVPPSIIYNELLPIYESSDPQIFERLGLRVERDGNGRVRVSQPPGERNALGQMRFNFPNKFLVYQHDTPEQRYFAESRRAYSHGCMRVQDPVKYAEVLLSYASPNDRITVDDLGRMIGGAEKQLEFANPIPVHITYQTAFVDDAGTLQLREDVYGLDRRLMSILRSSERQVADVAVARPADPNFRPTPKQGARLRSVTGGVPQFEVFDRFFR